MKFKMYHIVIIFALCFTAPNHVFAQKRIEAPTRNSGIPSADAFVKKTFEMYNNVFVYDSLTQAGVELPEGLEDDILEHGSKTIDSLTNILPDVMDDIVNGGQSFIKKSRATLNLNKAKKALIFCGDYIKTMILGTKEEEE